MQSKRLVIIDGYSLLYRAFFATRYLSTSDGRPTNALYGFVNMMFNLLENIRPDAIVVALDAPGKTFRHADYAEYKGTRRETAPELKQQLPLARELLSALGIPQVEVTGFEADDVVGSISRMAIAEGYQTTIVTGDLDALQLVDEHVSVLTMKQGVTDTVTYDPAAVEARYGFGPEYIPDYKAIVGDTSDNIPGCPGIGQKGATELIQKFGDIETLLSSFDTVDAKYQKKIAGNEEQMRKSRWLATIVRNVDVDYDFQPFVLTPAQMEKAKSILELFEFRSQAKRIHLVLGPYMEGANRDKVVVEAELDTLTAKVVGVKTLGELESLIDGKPYALFFAHKEAASDLFDAADAFGYLCCGADVWEVTEIVALQYFAAHPSMVIAHDSKALAKRGAKMVVPPYDDTMIGGYVLQSGRSSYALRDLVQGYLDITPPTDAGTMTLALYQLAQVLRERMAKEEQLKAYLESELPVIPVLAAMEAAGITVERAQLKAFSASLEEAIGISTKKIHELAGEEFNIGSPKQMGEILFEKMGIPGGTKTKTGWATGAEVLQLIAPTHEIAAEIMNWRELSKLKSTYTDALERLIRDDGRIHTTYQQSIAATGRLSSIDPNLQNIPIRTELGRSIRKAFVSSKGCKLASFDYSQIELRILAHLCGDEALVRAFQDRVDVHTVTAEAMFGGDLESVSKEQRRLAKMLNYAVLYGVTDFGLAQQLGGGFSIAEAKALIEQYFERFGRVKQYTLDIIQEARSKGFTVTMFGRRRYFPDIHAVKFNERKYAERQAINAPIQGTAADMMKLAMVKVWPLLKGQTSKLLLNVHDELVFDLAEGEESLVEPIREAMEDALPLSVPVEVDCKIGLNWNEMQEVPRLVRTAL